MGHVWILFIDEIKTKSDGVKFKIFAKLDFILQSKWRIHFRPTYMKQRGKATFWKYKWKMNFRKCVYLISEFLSLLILSSVMSRLSHFLSLENCFENTWLWYLNFDLSNNLPPSLFDHLNEFLTFSSHLSKRLT